MPYPDAKRAFMGMGFPEWQTDGILELFHFMDEGEAEVNLPVGRQGDIERLTKKPAMTLAEWCLANAPAFK